jgi:DNA-binding NarL/FixJ family response regulator
MDASRRRIRVLIADDHEVVRCGIRALLETEPGIEVCGEAATGREAVQRAQQLRPDVAIMDVSMPELNGFETTRRIREVAPECEVLVFTFHDTEQVARDALDAGARGYVLKSQDARRLLAAVESLGEHKPFFSSPAAELLLEGYLGQDASQAGEHAPSRLTPRQREVLQLLAEGRTNKDVARLLDITVKTVETHRTNLMSRLGLHSVGDLVRYAIRENLVQP